MANHRDAMVPKAGVGTFFFSLSNQLLHKRKHEEFWSLIVLLNLSLDMPLFFDLIRKTNLDFIKMTSLLNKAMLLFIFVLWLCLLSKRTKSMQHLMSMSLICLHLVTPWSTDSSSSLFMTLPQIRTELLFPDPLKTAVRLLICASKVSTQPSLNRIFGNEHCSLLSAVLMLLLWTTIRSAIFPSLCSLLIYIDFEIFLTPYLCRIENLTNIIFLQ